ncbi:MAG TPA: hypothetical protein V6D50_07190, partial [Chroococcales cyanobacterium]
MVPRSGFLMGASHGCQPIKLSKAIANALPLTYFPNLRKIWRLGQMRSRLTIKFSINSNNSQKKTLKKSEQIFYRGMERLKFQRSGLITICGATATGKSGLALALAQRLGSVILSADSRQVY